MSGHSHWSSIKHKKAAVDAKRGRLWSKVARNIMVAAKTGGGDPNDNLALRYAIDKAKEANMPKDSIEKAIKKGTGELGAQTYSEVLYEGYGHGGVAIMCEALTDNRNRTAGELRNIFEKKGASLGAAGCVAWMFAKKAFFSILADQTDEDSLMDLALQAGAEDFQNKIDRYEITAPADAFTPLQKILHDKNIKPSIAEIAQIPSTFVPLDENNARKILDLMENLEDHEDVQNVYANFDIPDDVLKKIENPA